MPITSSTPYVLGQPARVIIDCSRMFQNPEQSQSEEEVTKLLAWVRSCPHRSNIHVVLAGYRNQHVSRTLQGRLQALGCTVIARHKARA